MNEDNKPSWINQFENKKTEGLKRKRKNRTKDECQKLHAKKRFHQRTGIKFSEDMNDFFINMIQDCQSKNTVFIEKQSNRISIWGIEFKGEFYRVAYDKVRKNIVTVFPEDKIELSCK